MHLQVVIILVPLESRCNLYFKSHLISMASNATGKQTGSVEIVQGFCLNFTPLSLHICERCVFLERATKGSPHTRDTRGQKLMCSHQTGSLDEMRKGPMFTTGKRACHQITKLELVM